MGQNESQLKVKICTLPIFVAPLLQQRFLQSGVKH